MNGVAYYRIKRGLSKPELSELANVNLGTIFAYENPENPSRGNGYTYLRLSDALGVPIDELVREDFPDIPDPTTTGKPQFSRTANPENIITRYRDENNLTFAELSKRFGITSREGARKACKAEVANENHISALATYEGITPEEFIRKYNQKRSVK